MVEKTIAEELKEKDDLKKELVKLKKEKKDNRQKRISELEKEIKEKDELIERLRAEKSILEDERNVDSEVYDEFGL